MYCFSGREFWWKRCSFQHIFTGNSDRKLKIYRLSGRFGRLSQGTNQGYLSCTVTVTCKNFMVYAVGGCFDIGTLTDSFTCGNVSATEIVNAHSLNGGIIGGKTSVATVTNCYRSSKQVLKVWHDRMLSREEYHSSNKWYYLIIP